MKTEKKEPTVKFMNEPPSANKIAEVLAQCLSEQYGVEVKCTVRKKEEQSETA